MYSNYICLGYINTEKEIRQPNDMSKNHLRKFLTLLQSIFSDSNISNLNFN